MRQRGTVVCVQCQNGKDACSSMCNHKLRKKTVYYLVLSKFTLQGCDASHVGLNLKGLKQVAAWCRFLLGRLGSPSGTGLYLPSR